MRKDVDEPPSSGPARSLREAFQQVLGEDVDRRLTARAEAARTALSQIRAQQALREAARINAAADAEKEAEAAAEE